MPARRGPGNLRRGKPSNRLKFSLADFYFEAGRLNVHDQDRVDASKPSSMKQSRLVLPDGSELVLQNSCSIGRTPGNDVILPHDKVSRRHALIHAQEHGRFCFVDLGSSNGSYINGRRVIQPVILKDQDQIDLGPARLVFRDPSDSAIFESVDSQHTLHEIRSVDLWLMVADLIDSTRMASRVNETEVPQITGRWLADCKTQIEAHGGSINKFLGDGLLAYWPAVTDPAKIADALRTLRSMQEKQLLAFRVVLHRGQVLLGGAGSLGEENLTGRDVNFVFHGKIGRRAASEHAFERRSQARPGKRILVGRGRPPCDARF